MKMYFICLKCVLGALLKYPKFIPKFVNSKPKLMLGTINILTVLPSNKKRQYSTVINPKRHPLWKNLEYSLKNEGVITKDVLIKHVNKFWDTVVSTIDESKHINVIFRLKYSDNQLATITELQKINASTKLEFIDYIKSRLSYMDQSYLVNPVSSIVFSYGVRNGNITPQISVGKKGTKFQIYNSNKLPIAFNPKEYGKIMHLLGKTYTISVSKNILIILNRVTDSLNEILYYKNNQIVYTWTDKLVEDGYFIREIGKSTYHFKQNELVLGNVTKKTNILKKVVKENKLAKNFITMDLETVVIHNKHVPYLLSWYDGETSNSYYIKNLEESNLEKNIYSLVLKAIKDICINKYKGYNIYLHNFSQFDSIFLIKYLSNIGICEPIINNNKLITTSFKFNNIKVIFNDSYLLLPSSLRKLAKSFNVDQSKEIFPYKMNDINYIGSVPEISYFSDVSLDEYNVYKQSFKEKEWNFKEESIKYCVADCVSLHQVISKFNELIFNIYSLNIYNSPTLPSLSFTIFRSHYLNNTDPNKAIHMLSGKVASDIRKSYTGGAVDMYIPKPDKGVKIFAYDVNSLYPFVMKAFKMPVGSPTYFNGDITKLQDKPFGFFRCKITTPEYLEHPIIQTHVKTKDGTRTIAPLGTWTDVLFSEEIYNAEKYGYKFEILDGYCFNSSNIFSDFVNDLYQIRLQYHKSDPMNYTAKLLMNSLYGRFALNDNFSYIDILNKKEYLTFEKDNYDKIDDVIKLDNKYLVSYHNNQINLDTLLDNGSETHNTNIAISSAISAYGRIHMSQFKNNPTIRLYYSDTDSLYIDTPLDNSLISETELGKLKLENICDSAVFIAPKVYGLQIGSQEKIKIKGLVGSSIKSLTITNLNELLLENHSLTLSQDKWYKSLSTSSILVRNQLYTLRSTDNKRELLYKNNLLIRSKPYTINENKEIL